MSTIPEYDPSNRHDHVEWSDWRLNTEAVNLEELLEPWQTNPERRKQLETRMVRVLFEEHMRAIERAN